MSGRSLRRTKLKSTLNGPLRTSASSQVEITTTSNLQCSFLALTVANYGFNILYPKRDRASHQNVEHVSIYLCWIDGKSKTNSKIIRKAELTLLNADQQVLNHVILKPNAVAKTGPYFGSWQLKAHLQQQQIEAGSLLPSDTLHIHCKLVYESNRNTTKIQGSNSTVPFSKYVIPNGSLAHRFESLFDKDMSFTD